MVAQTPCMICHDKHNFAALDQLRRIERFCGSIEVKDEHMENGKSLGFEMDIHIHCRYGLQCPHQNTKAMEAKGIARRISPVLITIARGKDDGLFYELLQLLRGYFPYAYRKCEQIHHQKTM